MDGLESADCAAVAMAFVGRRHGFGHPLSRFIGFGGLCKILILMKLVLRQSSCDLLNAWNPRVIENDFEYRHYVEGAQGANLI
jgi:hypothetical protein